MNTVNINDAIIGLGILLFIAAIALTISSAAYTLKANERNRRRATEDQPYIPKKVSKWPAAMLLLSIICIISGNSFTVIPTGYTGVRTTFGLIDQESCKSGFNLITPFVQDINLVNNKQQDIRITETISGETNTQTVVLMDNVAVTYRIIPESSAWIYANVENWVEELVDADIIGSALRTAARRCQDDTVTDRLVIEPEARKQLQAAVDEKYGENRVEIKNVIIVNIDFEQSYNEAIAKKAAATQEQQEQEIRNATAIKNAEAKAEQDRALAQGEADAERIRAQGKADANNTIAKSITEATQRQDAIDKWDGTLPKAAGDNVTFGILEVADTSTTLPKTTTATENTPATAYDWTDTANE